MHERTQRQVCRVVYVLACVVPTVLTVVSVLYFNRPWQKRDWQNLLEDSLHVRASISQVTATCPGERQLYKIRLDTLHSTSTLATIEKLHLQPGNSLQAEQVEIAFKEIGELTRLLQGWLSTEGLPELNIKVDHLLLSHNSDRTCKLVNVVIAVKQPTINNGTLSVQADVITSEAEANRVRLQIERTKEGHWDVTLDCQQGQLPAWLFAELLPGASRWHSAYFTGSMKLHYANDFLDGTLNGSFAPIELQEWLGYDSPHKLNAIARIQFDKLRWQDHRITEAQGSINAGAGEISRSLTIALAKSLYCVPGKGLLDGAADEAFSYDKLACNFTLNDAGLTAAGNCSTPTAETSGCILMSGSKPILLQPTYSNLPLNYFVQVFCPLDKYWLPGMRRAADLAETLPLSESENLRK